MKIRTQLMISIVIFGITLLLVSGLVLSTSQQVDKLEKQQDLLENIEIRIGELGYISNDFILNHDSQQIGRWEATYSVIGNDIVSLTPERPDQQAGVNAIIADYQRLNLVFYDVVSAIGSGPGTPQPADNPLVFQVSWSRIAIQHQNMLSDVNRLSQILESEQDRLMETRNQLIFILGFALIAFLATLLFLFYRRTLASLAVLHEGTKIIGRGNFDFVLPEKSDDEIGALSHAFNQMTASLKTVTASKVDLEREVIDRELAQEAQRKSEEELRIANTAAIRERDRAKNLFDIAGVLIFTLDTEGRVTLINRKGCEILGRPEEEVLMKDWVVNFLPLRIREEMKAAFTRVIAGGITDFRQFENPVLTRDGEEREILWSNTLIKDTDGRITGILSSGEDITERKQAEEALKRSLAEKEILLSEVHHRVKNNLAAFISLLSLEGSSEDTPAGRMLRQDLQNRARSMALIHETLYRTHQYSEVVMDVYLNTLVGQVVNSYTFPQSIRIIVEAQGISLDLARATPVGLIVNELVTNSLKHAFPKEAIGCRAEQKDPCTIGIRLTKANGSYLLNVYDNGVGMRNGIDPLSSKSLGLKLVTFLAKHQLRAKIEVNTGKGTEFNFRFNQ
jgi:two-component system, cell cycle response regulator